MEPNELYYKMALIRAFETRVLELFGQGNLHGTTHCCIGQEIVAVSVCSQLSKQDIVVSNHRGHGHYIAKTGDVRGLMAELMGRPDGICGGRGGSQHLCNAEHNFYSNGVLGNMIPVAVGMAFAEKRKNSGARVVAFLGDGALGQGVVYEAFNLAALYALPILFVIEHNGIAQSTRTRDTMAGTIARRAEAFGLSFDMVGHTRDVNFLQNWGDVLCVPNIRHEILPKVIAFDVPRLCAHSKGDDLRKNSEMSWLQQRDPLRLAAIDIGIERAAELDEQAKREVADVESSLR